MDFTLKTYSKICDAIRYSSYKSITVAEFINKIKNISLNEKIIILRHDVDRFPKMALSMAKVEYEFGLKASYYFRIPSCWAPSIIKKIENMGHEVGLHYECLDKAKGNIVKAFEILKKDIEKLSDVCVLKTICMHGNPLSKYDNRDIWNHYKFEEVNIIGEAYISIDFKKILYYSDTGRTWIENKFNIKDYVPDYLEKIKDKPTINTTNDLIKLIWNETRNLYILTHPERWSKNIIQFILSYNKDVIANVVKYVILKFLK